MAEKATTLKEFKAKWGPHLERVMVRNGRLRRLIELNAPEVILRNEIRMLQDSIDWLIADLCNAEAQAECDRRNGGGK